MARDKSNMMWVDGISPETKEQLKALALKRFGKANASLMVRHLIAESINRDKEVDINKIDLSVKTTRVHLRFPASVLEELERRSEQRLSSRNYFIGTLVYKALSKPQLLGDEIEVLRRSNYELTKIGTNLNQVAKAFNLLVLGGGGGKLPEIGKKIAAVRTEIRAHTSRVLGILETRSSVLEASQNARARKRPTKKKY
ncbi:plasmid mobilization relaxosome protein MobC [Massilia sp. CCM 9210]|uniref:plasmid mobilization relaxosome protein MobC n=1 Tax=Massilia scottii TaxID=3057166 RepID=UPI00279646FA|nr:plasmid mobilization relaxosome protein MobC [Massilia sp. CCM 9210]MDQ1817798.1 plasmid mobilization relaxosome protein MobC [Massilia sp. CCM 9210]